jgi:hypothetical protein
MKGIRFKRELLNIKGMTEGKSEFPSCSKKDEKFTLKKF